jgi:parvulin-like peptidyl-prolyl isomerase
MRQNIKKTDKFFSALRCLLFIAALSTCTVILQAGEVVERIAAVVNDEVITLSEVVVSFNLEQGDVTVPGKGDLRPILDQLINREIVYQEILRYEQIEVAEEEIGQASEAFRRNYQHPENLDRILEAGGVSEDELVTRLVKRIVIEKFLNERFLPYIQVTPEDIETFYLQEFVPRLQEQGEPRIPPLDEVSSSIEALYRERIFNESVAEWMAGLKEKASIIIFLDE